MYRKLTTFIAIAAAVLPVSAQSPFDVSRGLEVFTDIYRQLDLYYVDTLSADTALQWAIDGMLEEIDPYTVYFPADDQDDLRTMATGRYAGIGAVIRAYKKEDRCVIEEPYEGCPALEAGVRAGDIIMTIDGRDTKGWGTPRVSQALRGEPGTTFELVVRRPGEKRPLTFRLTRRQIQTPAVPWYGMLDSEVGYLYLSSVTDDCARDVRNAIAEMRQSGMRRLLFDLRDNSGGSVSEAVEIVGMFLPKGRLVVSTKGKVPATCTDYRTPAEPIDTLMPVAVLVNQGSASAAEIISGALQDWDRATIIGQRTYGKGIVQGIRSVPYGGQLKITTARYHLPSGRCIQAYDYRRRVATEAATTLPDSLTHEFRTSRGRSVRDGGGILPDSVLAVDSVPTMLYDLYASDAFFDFVTQYVVAHPTVGSPADFSISDDDYALFVDSMAASGFTYNGRTAAALTRLRQLAQAEGRLTAAQAEFDALEQVLRQNDLRGDLLRLRHHIQPYIETEIVGRYYHQRGAMHYHVLHDKDVQHAREILSAQ